MARDDGTEAAATAAGSPKTVRNIHIALRRSLADALRFGLVPRNVATLVKPPSPIHAELSTWSAEEVRDFLAAVADDRLMPAYRLLASTGMRRGEVLGLRWSDVDLARGRLTVNRSLTVVDEALVWSSPKTSRSRRSLSLDPDTVAVLRAHRSRQVEEKLAAGPAWIDDDLPFCNELGEPLHPDRFTRAFGAAVRRSGVPMIRLHDLRHTWATLALQAGIHPKGRERVARSRDHRDHAPQLQPRPARARRAGGDDGGAAL